MFSFQGSSLINFTLALQDFIKNSLQWDTSFYEFNYKIQGFNPFNFIPEETNFVKAIKIIQEEDFLEFDTIFKQIIDLNGKELNICLWDLQEPFSPFFQVMAVLEQEGFIQQFRPSPFEVLLQMQDENLLEIFYYLYATDILPIFASFKQMRFSHKKKEEINGFEDSIFVCKNVKFCTRNYSSSAPDNENLKQIFYKSYSKENFNDVLHEFLKNINIFFNNIRNYLRIRFPRYTLKNCFLIPFIKIVIFIASCYNFILNKILFNYFVAFILGLLFQYTYIIVFKHTLPPVLVFFILNLGNITLNRINVFIRLMGLLNVLDEEVFSNKPSSTENSVSPNPPPQTPKDNPQIPKTPQDSSIPHQKNPRFINSRVNIVGTAAFTIGTILLQQDANTMQMYQSDASNAINQPPLENVDSDKQKQLQQVAAEYNAEVQNRHKLGVLGRMGQNIGCFLEGKDLPVQEAQDKYIAQRMETNGEKPKPKTSFSDTSDSYFSSGPS